MMKETLNVLVTSIGSTTALSVVKGLRKDKRRRYRIVGTDASPLNVSGRTLCDAFHFLPHGRTGWYIGTVKQILEKERVDVFIPIIDSEIELIAKQRGPLGEFRDRCLIADYGVVKTCNDKNKTYDLLRHIEGIGTPHTYTEAELAESRSLPFPVFIKPRRGISSIDCYRVDGPEELAVLAKRVENPIVSEFLPGDQYVIDTLSDANGRCLVAVPRREFEAKSGVGVKAQLCDDPALVDYGTRLANRLGIVGPACIEVMRDRDRISLIEVNPRVSASLALTIEGGVNIPALIVDLVLGRRIDRRRLRVKRPGLYMSRYWNEVYYDGAESDA